MESERPGGIWPKHTESLTSVCQLCELPICFDEAGWSDIWFSEGRIIYGPGGCLCHATAYKKPHIVPDTELVRHLAEIEHELVD